MQYIIETSSALQSVYDGPLPQLTIEILLLLGAIWLIFTKNRNPYHLNLTKPEEEEIIKAYQPAKLIEEISNSTNYALKPRIISGKMGKYININRVKCINFSSHDYFGFIGNEEMEEKIMSTVDVYGVGSCGPRGFYGTTMEHVLLEKLLADTLDAEDSLVYSYGFATAASAIPAYAKKADIIFADEKVNFAIQQGLDASRSEIKFFKHNNIEDLEKILASVRQIDLKNMRKARRSRRYLVVEGIYINTGEICPLPGLIKLCKKYKLRIFVDESISFGVLGNTGKGVTEYFGVPRADVDLIIGSLEFALASVGGFCVGSRLLIDHQQISGQGFCFSASLPPLLVTAAAESLNALQNNPQSVFRLKEICRLMHYNLNSSTIINNYFIVSGNQDSPVHVLTLKKGMPQDQEAEEIVSNILDLCLDKRVALTRAAFLPSDSAMALASLRITTCTFHSEELIIYLIHVLEDACKDIFFDFCKDI